MHATSKRWKWEWTESNCGDFGTARLGDRLKLHVRDCDGDFSVWSVYWCGEKIGSGETHDFPSEFDPWTIQAIDYAQHMAQTLGDAKMRVELEKARLSFNAVRMRGRPGLGVSFGFLLHVAIETFTTLYGPFSEEAPSIVRAVVRGDEGAEQREKRLLRRLSARREKALSSSGLPGAHALSVEFSDGARFEKLLTEYQDVIEDHMPQLSARPFFYFPGGEL